MHDLPNRNIEAQSKAFAQAAGGKQDTGGSNEGDCRPSDPCLGSLPACLEGYQNIVVGKTKTGDILVRQGTIEGFAPTGLDVEGFGNNIAIYRKMPCAKHLDRDYPSELDEQVYQASVRALERQVEATKKHLGNPEWYLEQKDAALAAKAAQEKLLEYGKMDWHNIKDNPPKAATYDDGKPPLARLPWKAIDSMAMVQAYGYGKYKSWDNWKKGMEVSRNASCALRHIRDYMDGKNADHESGCHPLAHAMIRLAYIIQNEKDGKAIDDR